MCASCAEIGHGLDEKAVEAVSKYRFKPSMEHGQPVPVEINVAGQLPNFLAHGKEPSFYLTRNSITLASTPSSTVTNPTVTGSENLRGPALPGLK